MRRALLLFILTAVFSFAKDYDPALHLKHYDITGAPNTIYIVGPEGDMSTPYQGGTGLLSAISDAQEAGASAANPIAINIKPGVYTTGNFSIPDGIELIGLTVETNCGGLADNPVSVVADYVSTDSASVELQNITLMPLTLGAAAFNVSSSTVSFYNCYVGNLNASSGTCIINCQNGCVNLPGVTDGIATFNFTSCSLPASLYVNSATTQMSLVNVTLAEGFTINCQNTLTMSFYNCTCGDVDYNNNGTLVLNFYASTISGAINKLSGNDAMITESPFIPPSP